MQWCSLLIIFSIPFPVVKCYVDIICALTDFIFILEECLQLLIPAPLAPCRGWQPSLGGIRGVNNMLYSRKWVCSGWEWSWIDKQHKQKS